MWEQFKKRVTDFIYEEIDEENQNEEKKEKKEPVSERRQVPLRTNRSTALQAKVKYEYPRPSGGNFRFPVIPDEEKNEKEGYRQIHEERMFSQNQRGRSSSVTKPAYMRRKERRRRPTYRRRSDYIPPSYETKRLVKEIEEVPAFERRKKKREEEEPHDPSYTPPNNSVQTKVKTESYVYSKPEELDAIFRRKDNHEPRAERQEKKAINLESHNVSAEKSSISQSDEAEKEKLLSPSLLQEQATEQEKIKEEGMNDQHPLREDYGKVNEKQVELPLNNSFQEKEKPLTTVNEESGGLKREKYSAIPVHLLDDEQIPQEDVGPWLLEQKGLLQQTLEHYDIDAEVVEVTPGPSVTRFEIQPALGVKVSRIRNLADDIKLHLAARDIRIEAPIPGKHTVGIEVPNKVSEVVAFQRMIESEAFQRASSPLSVALGLTIEGEPYVTDIHQMPHGLIAGATGSGKSVCINTMILSILYKAHFDEVKLMLIDPKMVELTQYNGIPHLLTPVITDVKAATVALKWAVDEMERRYELFVEAQVREIKRYNEKTPENPLPYIVIIIDELADLMLVSPQEVEDYISRIAQKARAAGIHLILATQRPSVDVITGLIKANIPTRIAFSVSSQVDSRTILDTTGAEKLLGKGDMLFIENGRNQALRLQGPFVSDEEIDRVVHYLRQVAEPEYFFEHDTLFLALEQEEEDELFDEVVSFVIEEGRASTSLLQRRFRIGYNRAARLIDSLYERGIVSAQKGSRPRDVLVTKAQWEQIR